MKNAGIIAAACVACGVAVIALFLVMNAPRSAAPAKPPQTGTPMNAEQPTLPADSRAAARPRIPDETPAAPQPPPAPVPGGEHVEAMPPPQGLRVSDPAYDGPRKGDRVAAARERAGAVVRELFTAAGVPYPPQRVYLRGFKREAQLEVWAGSDELTHIATWRVAGISGGPGPKRREGDRQVPEGFYTINRYNPLSSFHLSLGLDYPNTADRVHADPRRPGSDIFIHGDVASIGCLAMGDDRIEELYLIAYDARARPVPVHIFPARMDAPDWPAWRDAVLASAPQHAALWAELAAAHFAFSENRRIPRIEFTAVGTCIVVPGG